jgi:hypothetical protein
MEHYFFQNKDKFAFEISFVWLGLFKQLFMNAHVMHANMKGSLTAFNGLLNKITCPSSITRVFAFGRLFSRAFSNPRHGLRGFYPLFTCARERERQL